MTGQDGSAAKSALIPEPGGPAPDPAVHIGLAEHVRTYGSDYAGYAEFAGPGGSTRGVLYVLAGRPVPDPELQAAIDLARERGVTITVEERGLSYDDLWRLADAIAGRPGWRDAVMRYGVDVTTTQAVIGLDPRRDEDARNRLAADIIAQHAPHVRITTAGLAFGGRGQRVPPAR